MTDDDDRRDDALRLEESLERQIEDEGEEEPLPPAGALADEPAGKPFEPDRSRPAPTIPTPYVGPDSDAGMSQRMVGRQGLGSMLAAGARSLRRFPGLVAALYLVQVALSAGAALIMGAILMDAFGARPLFDRAMAGDIGAMLTCYHASPELLPALVWIGVAAVLLYLALSWFLTAGLVTVLLDPPSRRREVARWFGAGGAVHFFPFLRLALWSLLPYAGIAYLLLGGLQYFIASATTLVSNADAAAALARAVTAPLLLHWLLAAAIDVARVDLVRHPGLSALRALLRGFRLVFRRPVLLLHSALYGLVFAALLLAHGALGPSTAAGLGALIAVRQLTSFLRFVAHVALIGGQVELAASALDTPRRRFVG